MADIRQLAQPRSLKGQRVLSLLSGYVSTQRPVPDGFDDPVWVIVPSHGAQTPYGPLSWPATNGSTLPVANDPVLLAMDDNGTPWVVSWGAAFGAFYTPPATSFSVQQDTVSAGLTNTAAYMPPTTSCAVTFSVAAPQFVILAGRCVVEKTVGGGGTGISVALTIDGGEIVGFESGTTGSGLIASTSTAAAPVYSVVTTTSDHVAGSTQGLALISSGASDFGSGTGLGVANGFANGATLAIWVAAAGSHFFTWEYLTSPGATYSVLHQSLYVHL